MTCTISIELDSFDAPVVAPTFPAPVRIVASHVGEQILSKDVQPVVMEQLNALAASAVDVLHTLTDTERTLLFKHRHMFVWRAAMLPLFLQCVNWSDRQQQVRGACLDYSN